VGISRERVCREGRKGRSVDEFRRLYHPNLKAKNG
jgi:hypothetical protein